MLNIGEKCHRYDEDLLTFENKNIRISQYKGKIVLIAFVDIISGWDWLEKLGRFKWELIDTTDITDDDIQIIVVLYNYGDMGEERIERVRYNGPVTVEWINKKIICLGVNCEHYRIVVNGPWCGSFASDYEFGFSRDIDPNFNGNTQGAAFFYLLSNDLAVADKWSLNCSNNNDPVSFNKMVLRRGDCLITGISESDGTVSVNTDNPEAAGIGFFSQLFYNTKAFLTARILNLRLPPRILSANPPIGSGINQLSAISILFSKPVMEPAANDPGNYTITGGGRGNLKIVAASYRGRDMVENMVTLTLEGSAVSNIYDDSIKVSVNRAYITDTTGNRFAPDTNTITYKADVNAPTATLLPEYSSLMIGEGRKGKVNSIIIKFSKPVIGANNPQNYKFSIAGINVFYAMALENDEYMINIRIDDNIQVRNGDIAHLMLNSGEITDTVGNALVNAVFPLKIYDGCPSLVFNSRNECYLLGPGSGDGKNISIIEFSEEVKCAEDPSNYSFNDDRIAVEKVRRLDDNKYEITIDIRDPLSLLSQDDVTLTINKDAVVNSLGNGLTVNSIIYKIDFDPPEVAASNAGSNLILGAKTKNGANTSRIKFSKRVKGAEKPMNYSFSTDYITVTRVAELDGEYELTIFIPENAPFTNGEVVEMLPDFRRITDEIGNNLTETSIRYTVNTRQPSVKKSSSMSKMVLGTITKKRNARFRLSFTEDVRGAENPHIYAFSVKGFTVLDVVTINGSNYELTIHIDEEAPVSHGDELLMILDKREITNEIGNTLYGNIVTFLIDTVPPRMTAVPPPNSIINSLDSIEIRFTKNVIGADRWWENYALSGSKGTLRVDTNPVHYYDQETMSAFVKFTGSLESGVENQFIDIVLADIVDEAGNQLVDNKISYRIDTNRPAVANFPQVPLGTRTPGGVNYYRVKFTKPVKGAENIGNYTFSDDGVTVTEAAYISDTEYSLSILFDSGSPGADGRDLFLTINSERVVDHVGNTLADNVIKFKIDAIPPAITAFPQMNSVINSLNAVEIRYSKEVVGADRWENYSLNSGLDSIKIDPNPVHEYDGREHKAIIRVIGHIDEGIENEKIEFFLNKITDQAGNVLTVNSISWRVDTKRPSLIGPSNLVIGAHTLGGNNPVTIRFTKNVIGADNPANYSFSKEGIRVTGVELLTPKEYAVIINVSNPEVFRDGDEVRMMLNNNRVLDQAGNRLKDNSIIFTVIASRPEFSVYPRPNTILNSISEIKLSFTKDVMGADISENYSFKGSAGSLRVDGFVSAYDERTHTVIMKISGSLPPDSEKAPLTLVLSNISDKAGNRLVETTAAYVVETLCPSVAQGPVGVLGTRTADGKNRHLIRYTKPVLNADTVENYASSHQGVLVDSVRSLGNNEYEITTRMADRRTPLHGEKVTITADRGGIVDEVGNKLEANKVVLIVDAIAPSINAFPADRSVVNSLDIIAFDFSKEVAGADNPNNYSISTNIEGLTIDKSRAPEYDPPSRRALLRIAGHIDEELKNGSVTINIAGITDMVGNVLKEKSVTYTIDTVRPSVIAREGLILGTRTAHGFCYANIRFTKPVKGGGSPAAYSFSVDGIRVTEASPVGEDQCKVTIHMSEYARLSHNDSIVMTLNGNMITDKIGNRLKANAVTFIVDAIPPSFTAYPPKNSLVNSLPYIKLRFSKDPHGIEDVFTNIAVKKAKGIGDWSIDRAQEVDYDGKTRTLTIRCEGGFNQNVRDKEIEILINGITDRAGNVLAGNAIVYDIDMERPFIKSVTGTVLNADLILNRSRIQFSKPVKGGDDASNYIFSKEGVSVEEAVALDNNEYELVIRVADWMTCEAGETAELAISDNVTDLANNALKKREISYAMMKRRHKELALVVDYSALGGESTPVAIDPESGDSMFGEAVTGEELITKTIAGFIDIWKMIQTTDDKIVLIPVGGDGRAANRVSEALDPAYIDDMACDDVAAALRGSGVNGLGKGFARAAAALRKNAGRNAAQSMIVVSGNSVLPSSADISAASSITMPVYSIGLGDPVPGAASNLRKRGAGESSHLAGICLWPNLTEFLFSHLTKIYGDQGVQIVSVKSGVLSGEERKAKERFRINSSVRTIAVYVGWLGKKPLECRVKRGKEAVAALDAPGSGADHCVLGVSFGANMDDNELIYSVRSAHVKRKKMQSYKKPDSLKQKNKGGSNFARILFEKPMEPDIPWEIEVERPEGGKPSAAPYIIIVLAHDPSLRCRVEDPDPMIFAGGGIKLGVSVLSGGEPVADGFAVEAEIQCPNASLGNSIFDQEPEGRGSGKSSMAGTKAGGSLKKLLQELLGDSILMRSIRRTRSDHAVLELKTKRGAGKAGEAAIARGLFNRTEKPGIYRINYLVKGYSEKYGDYERRDFKTVLCGVMPVKKHTEVRAEYIVSERKIVTTLVPKDRYDNFLGPGYSHEIRGKVCGKDIEGVRDNLDGSYEIVTRIRGRNDLKNRKTVIYFFQSPVYDGSTAKMIVHTVSADRPDVAMVKMAAKGSMRAAGNKKRLKTSLMKSEKMIKAALKKPGVKKLKRSAGSLNKKIKRKSSSRKKK